MVSSSPSKITSFLWRLFHSTISVSISLVRRCVFQDLKCYICQSSSEILEHFFLCPHALQFDSLALVVINMILWGSLVLQYGRKPYWKGFRWTQRALCYWLWLLLPYDISGRKEIKVFLSLYNLIMSLHHVVSLLILAFFNRVAFCWFSLAAI